MKRTVPGKRLTSKALRLGYGTGGGRPERGKGPQAVDHKQLVCVETTFDQKFGQFLTKFHKALGRSYIFYVNMKHPTVKCWVHMLNDIS